MNEYSSFGHMVLYIQINVLGLLGSLKTHGYNALEIERIHGLRCIPIGYNRNWDQGAFFGSFF